MNKTRISLLYPAIYLTVSGIGLLLLPRFTLNLLFSNGHYDDVFVRLTGLFLLGLAIIVVQIIRYRMDSLYPTLVAVRVLFCIGYIVFYLQTADPLFLTMLAVVGLGVLMSAASLFKDGQVKS